ncbi:MAG: hypothetical protein JHC87_04215, partial [Thermoleophilaceae bacterium]|nr:hypothetical protein [Thermoleophilaceae bacterium]
HIGDSISDQMTPKVTQLNRTAGRKFFIDAQSGQSYRTMVGEARGIAAGIRDGSAAVAPDIMVIALGTNDVASVPQAAADFANWKTGLGWIVARVLTDTANVKCRVVMTVRDAGRDPGATNTALANAADAYNALIKQTVTNNPTRYRLVDWNLMAATHRYGDAVPWFSVNPYVPATTPPTIDRTHPNAAGLTALSNEILKQEGLCPAS